MNDMVAIDMNLILSKGFDPDRIYSRDELREIGFNLGRADGLLQWHIGDWYNRLANEDKEAFLEYAGISKKHAEECAKVCRRIPDFRRTGKENFSLCKTISYAITEGKDGPLNAAEHQDIRRQNEKAYKLLEQAIAENWNSNRVQYEVDVLRGKSPTPKPKHIPDLGEKVTSAIEGLFEKLPKKAQTLAVKDRLEKGINAIESWRQKSFDKAVKEEAQNIVREDQEKFRALAEERKAEFFEEGQRIGELRRETESLYNMQLEHMKSITGYMTYEEYRLVLGCLHPDRANIDPDRLKKAYQIFQRLEKMVDISSMTLDQARRIGWEKAHPKYKPQDEKQALYG